MARRRARDNPLKTRDKFLIGGGAALLLGGILYFATRPQDEKKKESANGTPKNGGAPQDGRTPEERGSAFAPYSPRVSWVQKCPPGYEQLDDGTCVKSQVA